VRSTLTDEALIGELVDTWAKAVRARDVDGVVAHHAADILPFDVPPPVQSRGLDEYKKSWEQFSAGLATRVPSS
jgi:ketosteroid isomerase-like protein